MEHPEVFGLGILLGLFVGVAIERYLLEPIAALRTSTWRARRRGR